MHLFINTQFVRLDIIVLISQIVEHVSFINIVIDIGILYYIEWKYYLFIKKKGHVILAQLKKRRNFDKKKDNLAVDGTYGQP